MSDAASELLGEHRSALVSADRAVAPWEYKFVDGGPEGSFEGYASLSTQDSGGDVIVPGAFDATIARAKATSRMPKMLLQHGGMGLPAGPTPESLIPIGKWQALTPDSTGLHAKGQLINLDTDSGKRIHGALKEGVLDGMSIGYKATDFVRGTRAGQPKRTIKGLDLKEVSLTPFPMHQDARVMSVKSIFCDLENPDWRDVEAALRDEGLSRADAVKAVSGLKSWLQRDAEDPGTAPRDEVSADELRALAARIRASAA